MPRTLRVSLLCFALLINPLAAFAQGRAASSGSGGGTASGTGGSGATNADPEIQAKIRKEEMEKSQAMKTLHVLTDVYGPRLTGSPNHKAAAEWAIKQMASWGFENAHLEPWDF